MVTITRRAMEAIVRHAEGAYPEECCGILLGIRKDGEIQVAEVLEGENVAEGEKGKRYILEPKGILKGEILGRELGMEIVGFYHSHPDEEAVFSKVDLELGWEGYVYGIVKVEKGKCGKMRGWRILGKAFEEMEVMEI